MALIELEKADRIATITLNRPEARNAVTRPMWQELLAILQNVANDSDIGCVVLTGADPAFCAGGDVKDMAARAAGSESGSLEDETRFIRDIMESSRLLHEMPKPTIAAINGACAGAGFALALACDLRLASLEAKLTTAFVKVGFSGDFGGSWFLSKIVGTAKARELYYLADPIDAGEAERLSIVNRAVAPEQLSGAVATLARQLANGPSVALAYMKQNMNLAETADLATALDQEARHMALTFRTEDHREAARAFVEKRLPSFKGK